MSLEIDLTQLDRIEMKLDEVLEFKRELQALTEKIGPALEKLESSPLARMFGGMRG